MGIAVWIVTGFVVVMMGGAGASKIARSKERILEDPKMGWADDFSRTSIKLIGAAEVAGSLGLVLPWALDVLPVLTPVAGYCLAALMTGAVVVHVRRREYAAVPVGLAVVGAALFVAIARTAAL